MLVSQIHNTPVLILLVALVLPLSITLPCERTAALILFAYLEVSTFICLYIDLFLRTMLLGRLGNFCHCIGRDKPENIGKGMRFPDILQPYSCTIKVSFSYSKALTRTQSTLVDNRHL